MIAAWHWVVLVTSAVAGLTAAFKLGHRAGLRQFYKSRAGDVALYTWPTSGESPPSESDYRAAPADPVAVSKAQTPGTTWALERLSGLMVGCAPVHMKQKEFRRKKADGFKSTPSYDKTDGYEYYYDTSLDLYVYTPEPGVPSIFDKNMTAWAEKCAEYERNKT